jgi:FkbM family methyltransferase
MKIKYEHAIFDLDLDDQFHRTLLRARVKKSIGSFIGKPYRLDAFLQRAFAAVANKQEYVLIDVGCNIGTTSLPVATRFRNGRVIAIDAHPVALARILGNIRANRLRNVSVVAAAISDQPAPLRIYSCANNSGGNRVTGFEGRTDQPASDFEDNITVPTMTLVDVLNYFQLDGCDVLKIDVEGYELNVLRSAGEALSPERFPLVILEYGPEGCRAAGTTGWEIVSYMVRRGYKCIDLHTRKLIEQAGDIPQLADFSVTDFMFDKRV